MTSLPQLESPSASLLAGNKYSYHGNCATTQQLLQKFYDYVFNTWLHIQYGHILKRAMEDETSGVIPAVSSKLSSLAKERQVAYSRSSIKLVDAVENKYPLADIIMKRCVCVVERRIMSCSARKLSSQKSGDESECVYEYSSTSQVLSPAAPQGKR